MEIRVRVVPAIKIGGQECPKHTLPQLSSGPLGNPTRFGGHEWKVVLYCRTKIVKSAIVARAFSTDIESI